LEVPVTPANINVQPNQECQVINQDTSYTSALGRMHAKLKQKLNKILKDFFQAKALSNVLNNGRFCKKK
jgi:hypothetical protein